MPVPSIKGSAFQSVADDVKRLVEAGRIDLDELGLDEKDRGLLDLVTPVAWVPVSTYARLLEALAEEEGGDDPSGYLRRRGRRAAERLLGGTYETYRVQPGAWSARVVETFLGIAKLLYNFGEWHAAEQEAGICIEIRGASELPEPALQSAMGFLEFFADTASGRPTRVECERPSLDRVLLRVMEPATPAR